MTLPTPVELGELGTGKVAGTLDGAWPIPTRLNLATHDPTWGWAVFISRVTHHPDTKLHVYPGPTIAVEMRVLDSYTHCPTVVVHRLPLPPYPMTDADREIALRDVFRQIACHESDEWFRVAGRMPFDPHRR